MPRLRVKKDCPRASNIAWVLNLEKSGLMKKTSPGREPFRVIDLMMQMIRMPNRVGISSLQALSIPPRIPRMTIIIQRAIKIP